MISSSRTLVFMSGRIGGAMRILTAAKRGHFTMT
jgi:hypothetical protein